MPPPSQLAIATSSLNRLVKEEASYHKELEQQQASIAKLEQGNNDEDENADFTLRQQRKALEETKAVFPRMKTKIQDAFSKLEGQLEEAQSDEGQTSQEDITKAKEAVAGALKALRETS